MKKCIIYVLKVTKDFFTCKLILVSFDGYLSQKLKTNNVSYE